MKKSVKILTLVLSLALICGALVVAAFADEETAVTGVRLDSYINMEYEEGATPTIATAESAGASSKTTNVGQVAGAAKRVDFKHQKGGEPYVATNPVDGNSYITVDWTKNPNTSSGHFFDSYTAMSAWNYIVDSATRKTSDNKTGEYFGLDTKYFVMDVDLMWADPANYDGTGFFYPYAGYTNPAANNFVPVSSYIGLRFPKTADGKVGVKIQNDDNVYEIGSDGTWSHVTYIMGFDYVEDDNGTNLVVKQWLAIDGVIVDNYNWTNTITTDKIFEGNRTLLHTRDIRLDVFGQKSSSGSADNYMIRTLTKDYNGNLATVLAAGTDLTAWESAVYTDEYVMPFGNLVAMIGETPYDSMEKAFADIEEGETLTLKSALPAPVVLDKMITIEAGDIVVPDGYISGAQGYLVVKDEESNTYTVEAAQGVFYITWESCTCGLDDCDETHPGGFDTEGWEGGTLAAAYAKNEEGKELNWTLPVGYITYYIAGWEDEDGNLVDVNTIITAEMCDDISEITLYPVIGTLSSAFCYTKGEDLAFTDDFMTAVNGLTDGGTITLLKDAEFHGSGSTQYTVNKNITIDLNGHKLNLLVGVKISGLFKIGTGKSFTIKGEKEGSTLYYGYPRAAGNDITAGGNIFTAGNGGAINLLGPNLTMITAGIYGVWSTGVKNITVDGVTVVSGGSFENMAMFYTDGDCTLNLKNSTFDYAGPISAARTQAKNTVINIENCAVITNALAHTGGYKAAEINIKDSYINAGVAATTENITISGDCYFTDASWIKDAYLAEGLAVTPISAYITMDLPEHTWCAPEGKWDYETTTKVTPGTFTKEWKYTTAKTVNVNVTEGGEALKTIATVPGAKVLANEITGASVADNWLTKTVKYWYTVDKAAAADVTVDVADLTDVSSVYAVGAPEIYFNYALYDNLTSNLYVPAELPEGLEITKIDMYYGAATSPSAQNRTLSGNWTIGGKAYKSTQGWPTPYQADEGIAWTITYTYEGQTFTLKVGTNTVAYAQKVAEVYKNDTEKMTQMTALLQYIEASNKINASAIANGLSEYLAELKTTYTLPAADAQAVGNLMQIKTYITGAKMTVVTGKGGAFAFTLNSETTANVTFKISVPVEDAEPRVIKTIVSDGKLIISGDYLPAWGAKTFNIDVLDAEGAVIATGSYSLAAYKAEMAADATADELALLDAIYALAAIGNTIN